jgi:hypothetical protein
VDSRDHHTHRLLAEIEAGRHVSQRSLARSLGIALGLTNLLVRRLVRKGCVRMIQIKPNRVTYLLTPAGIMEKTRLTYEFMEYSLILYGNVRRHLRTVLEPAVSANRRRVAIYGTGEAAELAYLSIVELGLELVAVFDGRSSGRFLGHEVRPIASHREIAFDLLLIASLERSDNVAEGLMQLGIDRDRLVMLRRD